MNWDYIAGFFDGEGNIMMIRHKPYQNGNTSMSILIRIYQKDKQILEEIRNFISYGKIYKKSGIWGCHELSFSKKEYVEDFILNLVDRCITKRPQLNYLLDNFNFKVYKSNMFFDIEEFRKLIKRGNVDKMRRLKTIKKEVSV